MATSLLHLRSTLRGRSSLLLQTKLTFIETHFADDSSKKSSLYDTLGVSSNATHSEIKKAYYDLTFRYHPDRNEDCNVSSTKFREVKEAYEILGNYGLRKKYDKGVPVSRMKKSVSVVVDHKAKFQEFFDSRTTRKEFNDRTSDFNEFATFTEKKGSDSSSENKTETTDSTFGPRLVITVFVIIAMLIVRA